MVSESEFGKDPGFDDPLEGQGEGQYFDSESAQHFDSEKLTHFSSAPDGIRTSGHGVYWIPLNQVPSK